MRVFLTKITNHILSRVFKDHRELPWMDAAWQQMGLNEVADNAELIRWLKSDGTSIGDPAEVPWCGDFVETCIRNTLPEESIPTNPYMARNWGDFGRGTSPRYGAIMVFWRKSRHGMYGHVGFYVGSTERHYQVLGGNQENAVSVADIAKKRLLCVRWPSTYLDE